MEKVTALYFRHKLFIFYFCSLSQFSYATYVKWSLWIMLFLLHFDHWLNPSDTLKRATGAKPDVASIWPMQCALMTSRHRENDRYWCVLGVQEVGIKYNKLSKICHHTQVDSSVTFWGCAQSKEAHQDHWLVDYSTVSAFGGYTIVTKMQVVQVGTRSSISGEHAVMRECDYICTASITESGLSYKQRIVVDHIKDITACCANFYLSQNKSLYW